MGDFDKIEQCGQRVGNIILSEATGGGLTPSRWLGRDQLGSSGLLLDCRSLQWPTFAESDPLPIHLAMSSSQPRLLGPGELRGAVNPPVEPVRLEYIRTQTEQPLQSSTTMSVAERSQRTSSADAYEHGNS